MARWMSPASWLADWLRRRGWKPVANRPGTVRRVECVRWDVATRRRCGHRLGVNQTAWQSRHESAHDYSA